ncbi:MAG: hypothetical protein ACLQVD_15525 [Capsulimonadaceae bacterium]
MIASKPNVSGSAEEPSYAGEPLGTHIRRIVGVAAWSLAPFVALLLVFGKLYLAVSMIAGGVVSLVVFTSLRIMVNALIGTSSHSTPDNSSMVRFAAASIIKFVVAAGAVTVMYVLHVQLLALLAGFVVVQTAVSLAVARGARR